jgi:hypothetical protein
VGHDDLQQVQKLSLSESAVLDEQRISDLVAGMGVPQAEACIFRAVEDIAVRLGLCARLRDDDDWPEMARQARSIASIADQVGFSLLAIAARILHRCALGPDEVARSATFARLMHLGQGSIAILWADQGMSI